MCVLTYLRQTVAVSRSSWHTNAGSFSASSLHMHYLSPSTPAACLSSLMLLLCAVSVPLSCPSLLRVAWPSASLPHLCRILTQFVFSSSSSLLCLSFPNMIILSVMAHDTFCSYQALPSADSKTAPKTCGSGMFILVCESPTRRRYKFKCPDLKCQNHLHYIVTPWLLKTSNKFRCPSEHCKTKKQRNTHTIPAALMRQHLKFQTSNDSATLNAHTGYL